MRSENKVWPRLAVVLHNLFSLSSLLLESFLDGHPE